MHKINQSTKVTEFLVLFNTVFSSITHYILSLMVLYLHSGDSMASCTYKNNICYMPNNFFTTKVCILGSISQYFNIVTDSEIIDSQKDLS